MKTFVIGGGNSITDETYRKLQNLPDTFIFCINTTFKFIKPDALLFLDDILYKKNQKEIDQLQCPIYDRFNLHPRHIQINITSKPVWEMPDLYGGQPNRGFLSGVCAISLCLALGHKDIYLLGFDGGAINGKLHHHDESRDKDVFSMSVDSYEPFRGKSITNLSLNSNIKVFKKENFENVINQI